jgi:hypothetical protein
MWVKLLNNKCVQQVFDFDCEDGLSVALSYGYDFTEIEEMERHICVPHNVHESALALQSLQTVPHGNVFVDLVLSHKKLLLSILQTPEFTIACSETVDENKDPGTQKSSNKPVLRLTLTSSAHIDYCWLRNS